MSIAFQFSAFSHLPKAALVCFVHFAEKHKKLSVSSHWHFPFILWTTSLSNGKNHDLCFINIMLTRLRKLFKSTMTFVESSTKTESWWISGWLSLKAHLKWQSPKTSWFCYPILKLCQHWILIRNGSPIRTDNIKSN